MTSQDSLLSLMTAERDLASRDVAKRTAFIKTWQDQVQKRRQQEAFHAREAAEEAKIKAPDMPIVLKKEFDINIKIGEALERLIRDEAEVTKRIDHMQAQLKKLEEDYALSRKRVDTSGADRRHRVSPARAASGSTQLGSVSSGVGQALTKNE